MLSVWKRKRTQRDQFKSYYSHPGGKWGGSHRGDKEEGTDVSHGPSEFELPNRVDVNTIQGDDCRKRALGEKRKRER